MRSVVWLPPMKRSKSVNVWCIWTNVGSLLSAVPANTSIFTSK